MTDRLTVTVRWTRGLRRAVAITIVALLGASPTITARSAPDAPPAAQAPQAPALRLWVDGEERATIPSLILEPLWIWLLAARPGLHDVVVQRCDAPEPCRVLRVLVETAR